MATIEPRPYQNKGIGQIRYAFGPAQKRAPLYVLPTAGGKCFAAGTPILRYDGCVVPIETIRVGDLLMGPDSLPRTVTALGSGREMMYRITPKKGSSYIVNESHILSLKITQGAQCKFRAGEIVNIGIIDYVNSNKNFRHCAKGWRAAVDFPKQIFDLPISPYILGVWLGDGHSNQFSITTGDEEILNEVKAFAARLHYEIRIEKQKSNCVIAHVIEYSNARSGRRGNALMNTMNSMRLIKNKHIPHEYKTADRQSRLEMLAGIIDTDGYNSGKGFTLTLKSERLIDDVIFVCRSLGFSAYKYACVKTCNNNGKVGNYFHCAINGDIDLIPTRVERKKAAPRLQRKNPLITGISVEQIGEGDYHGVEISGPNRLFMLGDFTVVHNTFVFSCVTKGASEKGNRVLILTHRVELVDQISASLSMMGVDHGYIAADYPRRVAQTYVANIQTLIRRLKDTPAPDLIIIDEAHHVLAKTWETVINYWPEAKILGVTATPISASGLGLKKIFDCMILGPSPAELESLGFLAKLRVFQPPTVDTSGLHTRAGEYIAAESEELMDKPSITGNVVSHYREHMDGLPAIAFCVSIKHAENVARQFREAGYSAMMLEGGTDRTIRKGVISDFRAGKIHLLTNCQLFDEGFDVPGAHGGIFLAPTQSLRKFLQEAGRVARPLAGIEYKVILDHVGNTSRFGLPYEDREWTLEGELAHKKKKATNVKVCPKCWTSRPSTARKCLPPCEYVWVVTEQRKLEERDGKLREVTAEEAARRMQKRRDGLAQSQANTIEALVDLWRARGYKGDLEGRARHVLAARAAKKARSET